MNGTTVVLKAPDPTASKIEAVMTPGKAAPFSMAMGREVAKRIVAPTASMLLNC
jgi:hypothetical protein